MGNVIRTAFRRVGKPIREFNLESRVEKVITQDKPKAAPRHPGTPSTLQSFSNKEKIKELHEIDEHLLKRLQDVYVTSSDPDKEVTKGDISTRPLPLSREYVEKNVYGYYEPKTIPYGKATIKTVLDFISYHNQEPQEWTAKRIAEEYKLDVIKTGNVLKYFNTFTIVVPPPRTEKSKAPYIPDPESLGARNVIRLPLVKDDKATS